MVSRHQPLLQYHQNERSDHGPQEVGCIPLCLNGAEMEMVHSFKFHGISQIALVPSHLRYVPKKHTNTSTQYHSMTLLSQKAKEVWHSYQFLQMHCRKHIFWMHSTWYGNCSAQDHRELWRQPSPAHKPASLPINSICTSHCLGKSANIIKNHLHPSHSLYSILPPGRRYKSLTAHTTRFKNMLLPIVIRLLNGPVIILDQFIIFHCTFCDPCTFF